MLKFIKDWTLPIAMVVGVVAYPLISYITPLIPSLIFLMLLFVFCQLSPGDIHFHRAHIWLLLIQTGGSLVVYGVISFYHPVVAQGAFICILAPTAIAATVITGMLGGSVAFITSYLLFCNIAVAIIAPLSIPLISSDGDASFITAFAHICRKVMPVLLLPLVIAWLIRFLLPELNKKIVRFKNVSFYLWAFALAIVTGSTVKFLVEQENPDYRIEIGLAVVSLLVCAGQFLLGRRIGKAYGDPVAGAQGLGQKNTILAIWIAQTYINPLSSVAPAAYVLWQNIINSYQLWRKKNRK